MEQNSNDLVMTSYMRQHLDQIAIKEDFKNYEISMDHGCGIGEGFVSVVFRVTIQEKLSDKTLKLIVKIPPSNEARRKEFNSMEMFEREIFAYNKILPEFRKLQDERGIDLDDGFFNFPKLYVAELDKELSEAIVIVEDLKVMSHQTLKKSEPIDFEHTKLLLTAMGKLHAISFALKTQKPTIFEEFKELGDWMINEALKPNYFSYTMSLFDQLIENFDEDDLGSREKVKNFKENYSNFLDFVISKENNECNRVMVHGDCWINNFMYRYRVRI